MGMKKVSLTDASTAQIAQFAREVLQLESVPAEREALLAHLRTNGHTDDSIYIADTDAAPAAVEASEEPVEQYEDGGEKPVPFSSVKGFGEWKSSPMVVCRILETERPGGNEPAHPQVNGSAPLVIQRNILVEIPIDFYEVLRQAGGTKMVPGSDPATGRPIMIPQNYSEYPMTDVVMPSKKAVAEWRKKTSQWEFGRAKPVAA